MKKFAIWSGVGLAALLAFCLLGKNMLVKIGLKAGTYAATGLSVDVDKLRLGIFSSDLLVRGLHLKNPSHYEERTMLEVPEFYARVSVPALLKREAHVKDLVLNMERFVVVKNRDGKVNLLEIKGIRDSKEKPDSKEEMPAMPLTIDRFELSIGKVVYLDYSRGGEPRVHEFPVGIDKEVYYDIRNPKTFASLLIARALAKTTIAKLANMDLAEVQMLAKDTMAKSAEIAKKSLQKGAAVAKEGAVKVKEGAAVAAEKGKAAAEMTAEKTKAATMELKETTSEAVEGIKGIFQK